MDPILLRALAVIGVVAAAALVGRLLRRRDGAIRDGGDARLADHHLTALGLDLDGAQAGAVLLGSPTCAPCTSVKRVLGEVAAERDDFRWVYADAADHHEVAEEHRVLRVPTLLVVDDEGRVLARTSGVPQADDLRRVLDGDEVRGDAAA